jgi:hypothetical protein
MAALEVGGGSSMATRMARVPSAIAGWMSFVSDLPTMTQAVGMQPASRMAASSNAGCGLLKLTPEYARSVRCVHARQQPPGA